ncbi:EAL domain-containing protein, partial [Eubacteriales bacterium OttesenSCG-928-M02]|nr:EAL domain-containing protein [Eubacteriales bacterium OttesenSCG-928-M02]
FAGGQDLSVFCSIRLGIVHGKYFKNEMRNLLLRTIAEAKHADRYVIYDEKTDQRARRKLRMRDALIQCVHNDMQGFSVHYQPIVEADGGRWTALEALCRWTMPNGEGVSPAAFIPIAEQLGLIGEVDAWVRQQAMQQCVALGLEKKQFMLSLNYSPIQRIDETFIQELQRALSSAGYPANKLNLEITENEKMLFDEESMAGLEHIAQLGVKFSLDDFGTGYSSLKNLMKIPAANVKIDKLFLDDVQGDPFRQQLLKMLAMLSKQLGMLLVAEGVETEEQCQLLKDYGVDFMQGYLFSRPLSYQELQKNVYRFD